jgi:hypothetical protein
MKANIIDKLKAEGWQERFTASGPRLQEAIDNYHSLGLDVKLVPAKELISDGCHVCFDDDNDETVMIFTRKATTPEDVDFYNDRDI